MGSEFACTYICMYATLYMQPSPLRSSIFGVGRYSACYQRRNVNSNPETKPLTYNLSMQDMLEQGRHRTCGGSKSISDLI